jgi:hypothetical protein
MNKNKIVITAIVATLLISTLALAVESVAARPLDRIRQMFASATWIRINGNIEHWGTTDVRGQLQTQARAAVLKNTDEKQLTSATAIWTTNLTRPISAARDKLNFTYSYYAARLPNASISTSNVGSSSNYFLNGTWNIAAITSTVTIYTDAYGNVTKVNRNQDMTPTKAYGELTISGNQFTLSIDGMEPLTGSVWRTLTRSWINPFKLTDSATDAVTAADVHAVAKCYRAMPGWGNYDTAMDFNYNYRVDIADISTVARNM